MTASAMDRHLAQGRRAVVRRAAVTSGTRAAVWAGVSLFALLLIATIRDEVASAGTGSRPWLGQAILAAAVLVAIAWAAGAWLGAVRVRRRWPALWDESCALPQTVETIVHLVSQGSRSPFAAALLESSSKLPLPATRALAARLPWGLFPVLPLAVLTTWLLGTALAIPLGQARSAVPSPLAAEPMPRTQEAMQIAAAHPDGAEAAYYLALLEDRDFVGYTEAALIQRTRDAAALWRDRDRRAERARRDAIARLLKHPATRALARSLLGEGTAAATSPDPGASPPDTVADFELDEVARSALVDAAALLRSGGEEELAAWLERHAAGGGDARPPAVTTPNWRLPQAVLELMRGQSPSRASDFFAGSRATGGTDPSRSIPAPEAGAPASESHDPANSPVTIEPGAPLAVREIEKGETFTPPQAHAEVEWEALSSRPEVEAHWLEVIARYRAILDEAR